MNSIRLLINQYLAETISEEDFRKLWATLDNSAYDTEWQDITQELFENETLHGLSDKVRREDALLAIKQRYAKLRQTVVRPPVHRVHFLKRAWFRYAAAIILLIGVGVIVYLWNIQQKEKSAITGMKTVPAKNDILPGTDRAILTLSNGQQVELNNTAPGTIKDGALSIENNGGQLIYKKGSAVVMNTMTTPKGGQFQLILADSTKVWLNAASSITYPTAFHGVTREVSITGEAYFEVAKDKTKPFHVKTSKEEITVLGTSFNVNSYGDEPAIKTSLLEGSVKIGGKILQPGQAYANGRVFQTDVEQDIAWKNGVFSFMHSDIKTVIRRLARWYDVEVEYEGEIPQGEFSGKIGQKLSLSKVMDVLRDDYGIHYRIVNRKLIIGKL